ncbi:unnamed protein product [Gadus morhua 'NCC']
MLLLNSAQHVYKPMASLAVEQILFQCARSRRLNSLSCLPNLLWPKGVWALHKSISLFCDLEVPKPPTLLLWNTLEIPGILGAHHQNFSRWVAIK